MARFLLTIFLSAFLLFQVQPVIGKYILPWYGGSPAVWTACLLFFQVLLLLGYAYAHWTSARLNRRAQTGLHLALLAVSLLFLPVAPEKPSPGDHPTRQILLLLGASIGLPYLLLSSTGPLVQRWFHATWLDRSPYKLYALSNAGSLLALLSYPFLVEPALSLGRQVQVWSWAYAAFVLLSGWSGTGILVRPSEPEPKNSRIPFLAVLFWLALAACGSTLLLATTNQMCREVAVAPFLWILPLALYLLTFMICFHDEGWYDRRWFGLLVGVTVPAACAVLALGFAVPLWAHIAVYSLALFACCMACHGELVRSKPDPSHLTLFYLTVAAGGALGGAFVAVAAPKLFVNYGEFHIGFAAASLLGLAGWLRSRAWNEYRTRPHWVIGPVAGLLLALLMALAALASASSQDVLFTRRSFYGILRLTETADANGPKRLLLHGRVIHGFQYTDAAKRSWPTAYYGPESAIGLAIQHHPRRAEGLGENSLRIGVVGLGAGTIAAYGRPGDFIRFYEINPDVVRIAESYFTYIRDSPAKIDIVLGDARIQMEQQAARGDYQDFDILAVDAFSSDAIPTHLLTAECAGLYRKHLKPGGLLLLHISNQSVDLSPVSRGLAGRLGQQVLRIESAADDTKGTSKATWAILTNNRAFLENPAVAGRATPGPDASRPPVVWTDDFASLWPVLKF